MEQNEILEETRRTNELLRGQLLWMRAAAALLAVLLAAVVVCLGNTMNSMGRISAALEGVDLAAVAEQVSKLDMDAVNRAISTPDGKISQMDVQAFNDAVAKLNGAVDALQSASDAVKLGRRRLRRLAGLFASRSSPPKQARPLLCRACLVFFSPPVRPDRLLHIWRPQRRPPPL
ncbi:MAG: hypothetical protein ACLR7U_01965 [Ruthenibacterium lactatiformans]